jgi:putative tricarboxylic transport membrane protein
MFWQSYRIAGFTSLTSAGVFPMLASAVMFGTAALNIWRVHRASPDAPAVGAQSDPQSVFLPFVLLMIGYLLALPWLGFVVASGLFLLFAFRILGSHRWGINLLIVCAALLIILLIFQTIFSVILPAGVLKGIVS